MSTHMASTNKTTFKIRHPVVFRMIGLIHLEIRIRSLEYRENQLNGDKI